jgi:hypothetical protein
VRPRSVGHLAAPEQLESVLGLQEPFLAASH